MPQDENNGPPLSYKEMEDWPATPGTQRMLAAHELLNQDPRSETGPGDLEPDARMLYLVTALHHITLDNHLIEQAGNKSSGETFTALMDHAGEADTEYTIGALTFAVHPADPAITELQHIFALVRDPDWMGTSAYLPSMFGKRITIYESVLLENKPGLVLARPERGQEHEDPRETPFPTGEPQLLRDILQWHGATSCHWIPGSGPRR